MAETDGREFQIEVKNQLLKDEFLINPALAMRKESQRTRKFIKNHNIPDLLKDEQGSSDNVPCQDHPAEGAEYSTAREAFHPSG